MKNEEENNDISEGDVIEYSDGDGERETAGGREAKLSFQMVVFLPARLHSLSFPLPPTHSRMNLASV